VISAAILGLLVYVALAFTTLSIARLVVMMWRDWKRKQLW
jgi:hypothetical protein